MLTRFTVPLYEKCTTLTSHVPAQGVTWLSPLSEADTGMCQGGGPLTTLKVVSIVELLETVQVTEWAEACRHRTSL
jgi:hypothetical protein